MIAISSYYYCNYPHTGYGATNVGPGFDPEDDRLAIASDRYTSNGDLVDVLLALILINIKCGLGENLEERLMFFY